MKILNENHRCFGARFGGDDLGELGIHLLVCAPVAGAKRRTHIGQMTERPQALVGEAVVIPLLLIVGQPDPAQCVAGVVGRHSDLIVSIHGRAIGAAGAVRNPNAGAGPHDGLERSHHAARRNLPDGLVIGVEIMDVGFAVRHDDHLRGIQLAAHHLLQRLRRPVFTVVDFEPLLLLGLGQHLAHLRQDRQRMPRRLRVVQKPLPTDIAEQHLHPAPQLQPCHQHDQQREQQNRDADECQDEIPRRPLPPVDEAQVVQHEHAKGPGLRAVEVEARYLHRTGRQLPDLRACRTCAGGIRFAGDGRRGALGLENGGTVGPAHQNRQQAFIRGDFGEIKAQPAFAAVFDQIRDRLFHRMHDQLRAQFNVRAKPLRQQPLDIGQAKIRNHA